MSSGTINPYTQADFDSIETEKKWVGKADARLLRDTCAFEWQRPISDRNVDRLAMEMRRGWFVSGTNIFVAVLPDNSMKLLNGNHTLEAVCAADVSIPLTFTYRRVRDLKAAGAIYAVLDIQKVRTWRDSLQATGKENFPMSAKVMSAMGMIMSDFVYDSGSVETHSSRTLRFDRMDDYRVAAGLLEDALSGAPRLNVRIILRSANLAVALETARYQPSTAHEFWRGMANDDGLSKDDPRKALLRYGMNNLVRSGSQNTVACRAAALAWNAYFKRLTLEYCKPNATSEFKLLGTPWSGGRARALTTTGLMVAASGTKPIAMFNGGQDAH